MNKKTLKIAGWALGLSMAVMGVGITIGTSQAISSESITVTADGGSGSFTPNQTGTNTTGIWRYVSAKGSATSDPAISSSKLRLYAKNTFTVSTSSDTVTKIDSITFAVTVNANSKGKYPDGVTSSQGTVSYDSEWGTGAHTITINETAANCKSVTFTLGGTAGNFDMGLVSITYTPATLAQTITGASEAYVDETVPLSSNALSPSWSIVPANTDADGASVTSDGKVTVSGAGKVEVKATSTGYSDATHTITFVDRPAVPYLVLAQDSYDKYVGDPDFVVSFTYGYIDNANVGDISFESNHPEYADVKGSVSAEDGVGTQTIQIKSSGTATFTVSYGGEDLALFEVVVKEKSIAIELDKASAVLWSDSTLTLTPTILAEGYSESVVWESDNVDVATVLGGVVTPVSSGVANIKCKSVDCPSEYATCAVTVKIVPSNYYDLDLATDKTTTATTTEMTWSRTYGNLAIDKEDASTPTNNYYPSTAGKTYTSTRFYKGSVLTLANTDECSVLDFTATSESYANALADSAWTNATAVATDKNVRVYVTNSASNVSCTIGATCGFTNIRFYTGKSWSEDFIDTFTCTGVVAGHLNGDISVANPTDVWSELSTSFSELTPAKKAELKTLPASGSTQDALAMARYDLIIRKYQKQQGIDAYTDFIGRFEADGANPSGLSPIIGFTSESVSNLPLIITIVSVGAATAGGLFLIRKKRRNED